MNWMDTGDQAIQMGAQILGGVLGGPVGALFIWAIPGVAERVD